MLERHTFKLLWFHCKWQISIQKNYIDSWLKISNHLLLSFLLYQSDPVAEWSRHSWFRYLKIWLTESSSDHAQLKTLKSLLPFMNLYLHAKKSSWFINSYLWYSWFQNFAIWLAKCFFHRTKLKIFKPTFIFLPSISAFKKSRWSTLLLLRYSRFKNQKIWLAESFFNQTQLKIFILIFMFPESISACRKSSWFINLSLRYSWFRNTAIWSNLFDLTTLKTFKPTFIFLQPFFMQKVTLTSTPLL